MLDTCILCVSGEMALNSTATTCDNSKFFYLLYQEFSIELSFNKRLDEEDQVVFLYLIVI